MYSPRGGEREGLIWDRGSEESTRHSRKPVGLKLDVSADILPRDTSLGTKLFTLVPQDARCVRDVKAYISNYILKTPTPFQIFVGEYRIREEENAEIFSVINEPCRLVTVPVPRSALSSTPKATISSNKSDGSGGSNSSKRVTFFDGDLSASPVESYAGLRNNATGTVTYRQVTSQSSQSCLAASTPTVPGVDVADHGHQRDNGQDGCLNNVNINTSQEKRKKRRRRRSRRGKKSKSVLKNKEADEDTVSNSDNELEEVNNEKEINDTITAEADGIDNPLKRKRDSESFLEQQDEPDLKPPTQKLKSNNLNQSKDDFNFLTPSIITRSSRKQSSSNAKTSKEGNCSSDSTFYSPSPSFSSCSSSLNESSSSGKTRQDTPFVPRIVKNPRYFESARKIINDFGMEDYCARNAGGTDSKTDASITSDILNVKTETTPTHNNEDDYQTPIIIPITSVDDIIVGDKLAFQMLELDERYNPCISNAKEGVVLAKSEDNGLLIRYTKNEVVVRTGKYELQDGDEDVKQEDEVEVEATVNLQFSELIKPYLLHRSVI